MNRILNNNFYFVLKNTPTSYPVPQTEQEALNYLTIIIDPEFFYNNINCYDIIDYEKLFYIEVTYGNIPKINELLQQLKLLIADGYIIKNKYKNRILDMPDSFIESNIEKSNWKKGYYGIPEKYK